MAALKTIAEENGVIIELLSEGLCAFCASDVRGFFMRGKRFYAH
jgi:hypothetical protein